MGIDPSWAKRIAWAVADSNEILRYGTWPNGKSIQCDDVRFGCDKIYIEGQYMGKNFITAQKLAWSQGIIMGYARVHKVPLIPIRPDAWMKSYKMPFGMKREGRLEVIKNLVINLVGEDLGEDLNAACLIALYGARRENVLLEK